MIEKTKELVHKNRLKFATAFGGLIFSVYNFFATYEIVIQPRVNENKAIITETREPKFDGAIKVAEPQPEPDKTDWRPPIEATDMPKPSSWAYYIRDPILAAIKAAPFDLVVTDIGGRERFSRDDVKEMKSGDKQVFAYASLGEAEKFRTYWKPEWNSNKPQWMGKESDLWKGVFRVNNLLHPDWKAIVEQKLIAIMDAGFDGIVIVGLSGNEVEEFLAFVHEFVKNRNSSFRIFVQDYIEPDALPFVDGVVKQNLVYNYGIDKLNFVDENVRKLREFTSRGKHVLVVSYTTGSKWALAKEIAKDNGFVIYNAPIKLDVIRLKQD